jgi:hypothetical protein
MRDLGGWTSIKCTARKTKLAGVTGGKPEIEICCVVFSNHYSSLAKVGLRRKILKKRVVQPQARRSRRQPYINGNSVAILATGCCCLPSAAVGLTFGEIPQTFACEGHTRKRFNQPTAQTHPGLPCGLPTHLPRYVYLSMHSIDIDLT